MSFQPLSFERSIQKAADNQEKAFGLLGVTFFHGIHNQQQAALHLFKSFLSVIGPAPAFVLRMWER